MEEVIWNNRTYTVLVFQIKLEENAEGPNNLNNF